MRGRGRGIPRAGKNLARNPWWGMGREAGNDWSEGGRGLFPVQRKRPVSSHPLPPSMLCCSCSSPVAALRHFYTENGGILQRKEAMAHEEEEDEEEDEDEDEDEDEEEDNGEK
jgi:hypothetical protein